MIRNSWDDLIQVPATFSRGEKNPEAIFMIGPFKKQQLSELLMGLECYKQSWLRRLNGQSAGEEGQRGKINSDHSRTLQFIP